MYNLDDFLKNPRPFIEGQSYDRFIGELCKVPDFREKFKRLISNDPKWLESALATNDGAGIHVNYFLDNLHVEQEQPNEIFLRNFHKGTAPTIKVETYQKKLVRPEG